MLGKGGNLDAFHQAWVDIWGMNVSPKARHFLWRACTNSLPTRCLLKQRHLIDDDSCPWGCGEVETTQHALFTCSRVAGLWEELNCFPLCNNLMSLSLCDLVESWKHLDKHMVERGVMLAWCLWCDRNL